MRRHPLRPSPCGEPMFVLKGLLMLLDDLMSNVMLLRSILIIRISSSRRNDSSFSINFVLLMVSKGEVISIPLIVISEHVQREIYGTMQCLKCFYHDDKHFGSARCIVQL